MAKKMKSNQKTYKIDARDVPKERRRRGRRIKEGDYIFKIINCERRKKEGASSHYFSWQLQLVRDSRGNKKYAGVTFYYITSLKQDAMFNLRNLIYAASEGKKNIAGKIANLTPSKYYGKEIGGVVEDDEYEGKMRSIVVDVMPVSEVTADEEEEDEEDEDEEEDTDEDDEDEDESDDEDEEEEEEDEEDEDEEDEDDLEDVDLEDEL